MRFISINAHAIRSNARHGTDVPPIRIARTKSDPHPTYAREVRILGDSRLVYDKDKALLRCGARMVLEAQNVEVVR